MIPGTNTAASYSDVYNDFSSLNALRGRAAAGEAGSLDEAAKQFEALFIQMMLKEMRAAVPEDSLFSSNETKQYLQMFDQQISLELAGRGSLGISEMLVRQLRPDSSDSGADTGMQEDFRPRNRREFIAYILPLAEQTAQQLGVSPKALIAQAALETGWGRNMPRSDDGRNSFNLFGIKAGHSWRGNRVHVSTIEFDGNIAQRRMEPFRAYNSLAESFADYARLLSSSPRYQPALAMGHDATAFAKALQDAGYATDPNYARKLDSLLNSNMLNKPVADLKNSGDVPNQ